jgi:FAD/FMN-containing dehydrogenase
VIVGGAIAWPAEEAPRVLEAFRALAEQAPPELALVAGLRKAPPAPWLPREIHGQDIVALFVCHTGAVDEGERLVAPIKRLGKPVGDIVQRRPYLTQQSLIDATQPKGRRYYWKSEYLAGHDAELLDTAVSHAARMASPHSAILLFPLDGALNRQPEDYSPAGNRDARSVFNVAASWERPDDDEPNIAWARAAWQDLRRFSTGGTYVNFLTEEEGSERIHAAYGRHYERLARVKAAWDPTNLFRQNKNIPPSRP